VPLDVIRKTREEAAASASSQELDAVPRNACAAAAALTDKQLRENQRCLDFFRYCLVTWSGKVLSCCFERFAVGDLNLQSAEQIWNGPVYRDLRRSYFEQGIGSICEGCTRVLD
jgi:hypothetical protein